MIRDPKEAVRAQFADRAPWYGTSRVHQHSEGLTLLVQCAALSPGDRALDVATGAGFTACALAAHCRMVVGVDFTPAMLAEAQRLRESRQLTNVAFCLGDAEALPFRDDAFDVVTCRHAAHHFAALERALAEMARVARPGGGRVILDDTCAPEDPRLALLMNSWERRRDPSHVANRSPGDLANLMERCDLRIEAIHRSAIELEFDDWTRRSGMSAAAAAALREEFRSASPEARRAFRIHERGGRLFFAWDEVVLHAVKA